MNTCIHETPGLSKDFPIPMATNKISVNNRQYLIRSNKVLLNIPTLSLDNVDNRHISMFVKLLNGSSPVNMKLIWDDLNINDFYSLMCLCFKLYSVFNCNHIFQICKDNIMVK